MPTLTNMARSETPPPDLDACKDILVKWYKNVFGFADLVATALYDEQLLRDKDSLAELNDNEVDNVMRVIRRHHAIAELSLAHFLDQGPGPHPAQDRCAKPPASDDKT